MRQDAKQNAELLGSIRSTGFAVFDAAFPHAEISALVAADDWASFAASWHDLPRDDHMADGGRYRRRRYGVFAMVAGTIKLAQHQPHYQTVDNNPLNGGIERWFAPLVPAVSDGPTLRRLIALCHDTFAALVAETPSWHVEVHQFRIEADETMRGNPTPEGMHRDGVDYVLVLLVNRVNIDSGTTTMADQSGRQLGAFTLTHPGDCVLLDDHKVFHGVTAVTPVDPDKLAYRDVLVVTFRNSAENREANGMGG